MSCVCQLNCDSAACMWVPPTLCSAEGPTHGAGPLCMHVAAAVSKVLSASKGPAKSLMVEVSDTVSDLAAC